MLPEATPLWRNQLFVSHLSDALHVLRYDVSETPSDESIGTLLEIMHATMRHSPEVRYIVHVRHVQSDHLDTIPASACISIARSLIDNRSKESIVEVLMECTRIDVDTHVAAGVFTLSTQLPVRLTASAEETQASLLRALRRHSDRSLRRTDSS